MSFGGAFGAGAFGGAGTTSATATATSTGSSSIQAGSDLQEIQSTELEFTGFNGETKIALFQEGWPDSNPPAPTSSLLSIAPTEGLLAAAGPDSIVIAKLESVRAGFNQAQGASNIRAFQPELTIPIGIRVSQVAFSADGSCLVISAEQGGGLAAYETKSLLQGNTNSAFELASDGKPLRALVPNPASEAAELFAAVTTGGELMIANLKTRSWQPGKNGNVHQEGVSSVAWSTRGKALLAGLGNGSVAQLKPDGTTMSEIPKPPTLGGDKFVSAISWLENDLAIFVYTPPASDGMADPSDFFIWERTPKTNPPVHKFSKLPEVAGGWGDRTPASQYMVRLKDFHDCDHIVLVASTVSEDVGVLSRSKKPLAEGGPVGVFTATLQASDSRRAQLPLRNFSDPTSPTGMALDISSTKKVPRPIPGDEYDESPGPLPGLMILNNAGVLAAWWFVYASAIRNGVTYSGLISPNKVSTTQSTQSQQSTNPSSQTVQPPPLTSSAPSFGTKSSNVTFGQSAMTPTATPTFGSASAFGQMGTSSQTAQNSQATQAVPVKPVFGQSAFGSPSAVGSNKPTFGSGSAAGSMGGGAFGGTQVASAPVFGSPSSFGNVAAASNGTSSKSVFGQAGGNAFGTASSTTGGIKSAAFGTPSSTFGGNASATSPFAQLAKTTNTATTTGSPFGSGGTNAFGGENKAPQGSSAASPFGAFGKASGSQNSGLAFGKPSTPGTSTNPFGATTSSVSSSGSTFSSGTGQKPFGMGGALDKPNSFGISSTTNQQTPLSGKPFNFTSSFAEQATKTSNIAETGSSKAEKSKAFFGGSFGSALTNTTKSQSMEGHEESMDDGESEEEEEEEERDDNEDDGEEAESRANKSRDDEIQAKPQRAGVESPAAAVITKPTTANAPESPEAVQSTTPKETPAAQKTMVAAKLFGDANETSNAGAGLFRGPSKPSQLSPSAISTTTNATDLKSAGEIPLPPESTSKDTFTPTNSSTSSTSIDQFQGDGADAPLPPDFLKAKPGSETTSNDVAPPLPPDFTKVTAKATADAAPFEPAKSESFFKVKPTEPKATDAPLPPDFLAAKPNNVEAPPPLPIEDASPIDDEGSGVDVANELSIEASPESSFGAQSSTSNVLVSKPTLSKKGLGAVPGGSKGVGASTGKSVFEDVLKPNVPYFSLPPPSKEPESPRSPSPVRQGRGATELKPLPISMRSVSGPAVSKALPGRKATPGRMQPPPQRFAQPVTSLAANRGLLDEERRATEKKRQEQRAAEEEELSDQEDDYIRAELEAPIQPTTKLAGFLAHTDYTGGVAKGGVPGQIEIVYRDVNSMIDTLGLNARAVTAWVAGHSVSSKRNPDDPYGSDSKSNRSSARAIKDLDDPDGWTLVEADEILGVENKIQDNLFSGIVSDKQAQSSMKLTKDMTADLNRLRRRNDEIARTIEFLANSEKAGEPEELGSLSVVASESQHDLRRALANFRVHLAAAEEGAALIKAKLVTEAGAPAGNVPTVEAVERTISKMTAMFEKRSADLDVLTAQAKQLGISEERRPASKGLLTGASIRVRSQSGSESPTSSRPGSTYGTPGKGASPFRNSAGAGPGQVQFTPSKSKLRTSLLGKLEGMSIGREASLDEVATEKYAMKAKVMKEVKTILKEALGEGKPRIRTLDDE